jgi:hypothetical protein
MTSGKTIVLVLTLSAALANARAQAAAPDLDHLLTSLARPAPATTPFVEVRYSHLLSVPLVTSGELEYRGPGSLGKRIDAPYRENTQIEGQDVRIERDGQKPRRFSLERAPELRGLLVSFGAMIGGDRKTLEEFFALSTDAEGAGWKLTLAPKDARTKKRIQNVVVHGAADAPRCFVVTEASGNASVLMVGAATGQPLPKSPKRELVDARCRGDGA